jgi:hypothetical protein
MDNIEIQTVDLTPRQKDLINAWLNNHFFYNYVLTLDDKDGLTNILRRGFYSKRTKAQLMNLRSVWISFLKDG